MKYVCGAQPCKLLPNVSIESGQEAWIKTPSGLKESRHLACVEQSPVYETDARKRRAAVDLGVVDLARFGFPSGWTLQRAENPVWWAHCPHDEPRGGVFRDWRDPEELNGSQRETPWLIDLYWPEPLRAPDPEAALKALAVLLGFEPV